MTVKELIGCLKSLPQGLEVAFNDGESEDNFYIESVGVEFDENSDANSGNIALMRGN